MAQYIRKENDTHSVTMFAGNPRAFTLPFPGSATWSAYFVPTSAVPNDWPTEKIDLTATPVDLATGEVDVTGWENIAVPPGLAHLEGSVEIEALDGGTVRETYPDTSYFTARILKTIGDQ